MKKMKEMHKEKHHEKSKHKEKHHDKHKEKHKKDPVEKKFKKVMHEWAADSLHSGSKKGPIVKSQRQAEAIAFSESGEKRKKSHHKKDCPCK